MPRHLCAYPGSRYLDHAKADIAEMRDHGFTGVVHCVTEADIEWSSARLGEIFALTRAAGLEVGADPWGVAGVFGGEAHSGFLGRNPGCHQRTAAGDPLAAAALDDGAFVAYMEHWVDTIATAGADTVFWDEPHLLPGATGDGPALLRGFLDRMTRYARDKGMRNSVCLFPLPAEAAARFGLPTIEDLAGLDAIDDVAVDPYPIFLGHDRIAEFDAERMVGKWADRLCAVRENFGVDVHLWIQGFSLPRGTEHLVEDCARAARDHGVADLGFWCYRAAEATSAIAPDDPGAVWEAARRTFTNPAPAAERK